MKKENLNLNSKQNKKIYYSTDRWSNFRTIIEQSVKKNGPEKPITIGHLFNIIKLVDKITEEYAEKHDNYMDRVAFGIEHADAGCRD